ncbi:MAG: class I SAM-dependent methyltransferase [Anaerolineales bacterium]|nr:class I SAM-dependent methyltransferase [Anaerolineales bacterium]
MMSLIHETLYGLFQDPYRALADAGLQAGQAVLEVGCGPGFFTVPASRIVGATGSVLALDINPFAVEHVQRKIEQERVANARVMLADAAQTNLPGRSFDLAFLFGFPHPVGDMGRIWNEIHRLLKPAGILAVKGRRLPPGGLFRPSECRGRISCFIRTRSGEK